MMPWDEKAVNSYFYSKCPFCKGNHTLWYI